MMHDHPGALALVGSGEYTPAMDTTDRLLLDTLGGAEHGHVALFPTASALEPGMPERWNKQGVAHFRNLGAHTTPFLLLQRQDAEATALADQLDAHNFFYFSGGNPDHCIETLRDTLVWSTLQRRHRDGAVLAGCSAGAMMLGGYTTSVREMRRTGKAVWREALGLVPHLAIMPHFDRMRSFAGDDLFRTIIATAPAGITLVGVDEDTALVHLPGRGWVVSGSQTVSVFDHDGRPKVYQAGEAVTIP